MSLYVENNNNRVSGCGICGSSHNYLECNVIKIKHKISDNPVISRARSTIPPCIKLMLMSDGTYSTAATTVIENGTRFGPLEAKKLPTMDPSIQVPLKMFGSKSKQSSQLESLSEYYFDTCDEESSNWMIFVNPAQSLEEQNLICFQEDYEIFYVTTKDIQKGEHLKLWYAPHYATMMGRNLLEPAVAPLSSQIRDVPILDLDELLKAQQNIVDRDNWSCKFCGKLENTVSEFATHMMEHYTKIIYEKSCDICKQSFPDRSLLSKHKQEEHKIKRKPKSKNSKPVDVPNEVVKTVNNVGGPLLNDILNDSFDNSNLTMANLELNQFSLNLENSVTNNSILENDNLSLNIDNLLMDNDHFMFGIGESQEQYVCDICLKSFSKIRLLRLHMKIHTGEFTCHQCLKIFSRSETLTAHICSVYKQPHFNCHFCQRTFMLKKHLKRHISVVHEKKYICKKCGINFYSPKEFNIHNCVALPNFTKKTYTCQMCSKNFFCLANLKKHLKKHLTGDKNDKPVTKPISQFICEACGIKFITSRGLHLHTCIKKNRNFECDVCNKKFYRADVLKIHMENHTSSKEVCKICGKECKTQRSLSYHMVNKHKSVSKVFKCDKCPKLYNQRYNLIKHQESVHMHKCNVCKKNFASQELFELHKQEHAIQYFQCHICEKFLKLKSSVRRHYKQLHPEEDIEKLISLIKPKEFLPQKSDCDEHFGEEIETDSIKEKEIQETYDTDFGDNNVSVNLDNIVSNFDNIIDDYGNDEYLFVQKKINDEPDVNFDNLDMEFDTSLNVQNETENNQEVCLSMPDLSAGDQEITLGENAYMLENGTIVDRKESGNYVCYVLN